MTTLPVESFVSCQLVKSKTELQITQVQKVSNLINKYAILSYFSDKFNQICSLRVY